MLRNAAYVAPMAAEKSVNCRSTGSDGLYVPALAAAVHAEDTATAGVAVAVTGCGVGVVITVPVG